MSDLADRYASLLDRNRMVGRLARLVQARSENPPGEEAAAGELTRSYCEELGLEVAIVEAQPGRPNILARWRGGPGPTVTYCSHIDVVPAGNPALWSVDPYGAEVADGVMHGRGTSDAKGPVAGALEAVAILRASGFEPAGTLELALVSDEETMGFQGAGHLVAQGHTRPAVAMIGEPTSLRLVRAQRGANWFRLTTHGLAAHGSAPERGRNAIRFMSEIVLRLEETMPNLSHEVLGGPSINVGTIHGGEKVNVIPASCSIEIDRRSIPGETVESITESLWAAVALARRRFPDLEASLDLIFAGSPFESDPEGRVVRTVAASIEEVTGVPAQLVGFRGASDARFFAESGAETVVCGPGDIAVAHTAREHLSLAELEQGALVYALSFSHLLGPAAH